MDLLAGLNPQQQEAVTHADGPLLILAGAGSGKTRVITHRIAHLVRERGVAGSAILAVTFTNKAAGEMRERVLTLLGEPGGAGNPRNPLLTTFHSFCVRLLRRSGERLADVRPGFTRNFTIYDDDDQVAVVKSVYRELGLDDKFMQPRAALSRISHAKNQKQTPDEMHKASTDEKTSRLAVVYEHYEGRLRRANALDFDDLLLEAVRLLRHDAAVRGSWNRHIAHLMVDEYQDTNRSQYELMRLLSEEHRNVCVVGDEDQSIYGWRGADIRNILEFQRDYPDASLIRLEQNYRSTKNILESASAVVARNKQRIGKTLWTSESGGELIGSYEAIDAENEALFIADTIERLLVGNRDDRVAILYRTNFQSRQIEEALRRHGRKYIVVGGFSYYQRGEVKDALAYLKVLASPHDSVGLLRVINTPARGIGKTTLDQIEQYAAQHQLSIWAAIARMLEERLFPGRAEAALETFRRMIEELSAAIATQKVNVTLSDILERTGYRQMLKDEGTVEAESRLANLDELLNAAAEAADRGETIVEFLDHAALVAEADSLDSHAQVSLLTMHNAKGLEFPIVFIAGLEEGLFPHSRSAQSEPMMEEERRLCYVGMTRAQKRLFLSWARSRRRYGGGPSEPSLPSRFLDEVPRELVEPLDAGIAAAELDLFAERHVVRATARTSTYTGKTYNSLENIAEFFRERGIEPPPLRVPEAVPKPPPRALPPKPPRGLRAGVTIRHPRYGRGTVLRREGDGDEAKLTVSFPGYGLKKLVAKYAGLEIEE